MMKHLCKLQNLTNLQEPNETYHCGTCMKPFYSICRLHHHMKVHCDEGSYIFDNTFKTAFLKHETTSSYTQTSVGFMSSVENLDEENAENIDTNEFNYLIPEVSSNCPERQQNKVNIKAGVKDKYKINSDTKQRKWKKPADKFQDYFESKQALFLVKNCVVRLRKIDNELKGCQEIKVSHLQTVRNGNIRASKRNLKESRHMSVDANASKSTDSEVLNEEQTYVDAKSYNEKISNLDYNISEDDTGSNNIFNFYLKNPDALQELQCMTENDSNDEDDGGDDHMDFDNASSNLDTNEILRTSNASCPDRRASTCNSVEADNKTANLGKAIVDKEDTGNTTINTKIDIKQEIINGDYDTVPQNLKTVGQLTRKLSKKPTHKLRKSNNYIPGKVKTKKKKLIKLENDNVDSNSVVVGKRKKSKSDTYGKKKSPVSANGEGKRKMSVSTRRLCDLCGLEFSRRQYAYHMLKHSGVRPHLCNHCGRSFYEKKHLVCHLVQHQTVKPHTCTFCNAGFAQKNELRLHMNIHTGSRPFSCKICDKSFNHSSNLRFHVKSVHLDEKKHECLTCKRRFSKKSHLENHMLSHSEASFECSKCMKKFVTPRNLKRHMATHSSQMFKCVKCEKKLPVLEYLYLHMERCHKISKKAGAELWKNGAIQTMPLENMTAEQRKDFFQKINKGTRAKKKIPPKNVNVRTENQEEISKSLSTEGSNEQDIL